MREQPIEPGKYLSMLIHAYNPGKYAKELEHRFSAYLAFLGIILASTALVFSIVVLGLTIGYVRDLPATLEPVHDLSFSGNVTADAPVTLLDRPLIVLDMTANGSDSVAAPGADLLFTQGGIAYPRYVYAGRSFIAWDEVTDLKRQTPLRDHLLRGIVLFLAPSLIFWGLVYHLGRILLLALLLWVLGYWAPRALRHHIGGVDSLKLVILTLPSTLLLSVGLAPLAPRPLFWWGVGLTVALFCLGIAMVSERQTPDWSNARKERK